MIELKSNILVSDGQWHDVKAQFNPAYMEVSVDGEKKSLRPRSGENKHIDLSGLLYFGGIEPGSKRQRAVDQGRKRLSSSLAAKKLLASLFGALNKAFTNIFTRNYHSLFLR